MTVPVSRLRELFTYHDGKLTRNTSTQFFRKNDRVGCPNKAGYLRVGIDKKSYYVHRVVWALVYGEWPTQLLDHINGDVTDNRIENLRQADKSGNAHNIRNANKPRSIRSKLGVRKYASCYEAELKVNYIPVKLGKFSTEEAAHSAYVKAKKALGFGDRL